MRTDGAIRVYVLARELNLEPKSLIALGERMGLRAVKHQLSFISPEERKTIEARLRGT